MNNLSERERERERESNNSIDLKTLDNEIAKIAGRAAQTPISMEALWNEIEELKNKKHYVIKTYTNLTINDKNKIIINLDETIASQYLHCAILKISAKYEVNSMIDIDNSVIAPIRDGNYVSKPKKGKIKINNFNCNYIFYRENNVNIEIWEDTWYGESPDIIIPESITIMFY